MLLNDFFRIDAYTHEEGSLCATLIINASHQIFEGHFPGQPVVPGVCMMQMVKEVLETLALKGAHTRLLHADHVKFLTAIDPRQTDQVELELTYARTEDGEIKMVARLFKEATIYLKYKGVFLMQAGFSA
jgi:3-hydroxyacyl-[acyl-carrier-protein] dehydratase